MPKRYRGLLIAAVTAVFLLVMTAAFLFFSVYRRTRYDIFDDFASLKGTLYRDSVTARDNKSILLIGIAFGFDVREENMFDDYGLIIKYEYENDAFISKYCLMKRKERKLIFTTDLNLLLDEIGRIPSGNRLYLYGATCGGGALYRAYVKQNNGEYKSVFIDKTVFSRITAKCRKSGIRFIMEFPDDEADKRIICTCIYSQ